MAQLLRETAAAGLRASIACGCWMSSTRMRHRRARPPGSAWRFWPAGASGLAEPLTKRELELLALIAQGLSNHDIAERLFISPQTVKVHVRNIYSKLGVEQAAPAVARQMLGILSTEQAIAYSMGGQQP